MKYKQMFLMRWGSSGIKEKKRLFELKTKTFISNWCDVNLQFLTVVLLKVKNHNANFVWFLLFCIWGKWKHQFSTSVLRPHLLSSHYDSQISMDQMIT